MEVEVSTAHTFKFVCTFDEAIKVAIWARENLNMANVKELRFSYDNAIRHALFGAQIELKTHVTVVLIDTADAAKFKIFQENLI